MVKDNVGVFMKDKKILYLTFVILVGLMSSCSTVAMYTRAMYGIPEPVESEASIRKKITAAVDKASSDIIKRLPSGARIAVLGGTSSVSDRELVVAHLKSRGYSDSRVRAMIQSMDSSAVYLLAVQLRMELNGQEISPGTGYADYAVEDLEYNMVKAEFRLVDRQQIERIRIEQQLQLSGEFDDNSAVSIGKMVGANSVIVISVSYVDKSGRLILKALDVQTAEIIAMARQEF